MEISKNFSIYDSPITPNQRVSSNNKTQRAGTIRSFFEAFRVDLSAKALASIEFNDPSINFPTYNEDVVQYNKNLDLTFKP